MSSWKWTYRETQLKKHTASAGDVHPPHRLPLVCFWLPLLLSWGSFSCSREKNSNPTFNKIPESCGCFWMCLMFIGLDLLYPDYKMSFTACIRTAKSQSCSCYIKLWFGTRLDMTMFEPTCVQRHLLIRVKLLRLPARTVDSRHRFALCLIASVSQHTYEFDQRQRSRWASMLRSGLIALNQICHGQNPLHHSSCHAGEKLNPTASERQTVLCLPVFVFWQCKRQTRFAYYLWTTTRKSTWRFMGSRADFNMF